MYAQGKSKWVKPGWKWPVVAVLVLVPVVSLYFSETWATRAKNIQADEDFELAAEGFAKAQQGPVFNPDHVSAEGINIYTLASLEAEGRQDRYNIALGLARRAEALDRYDGQHYQLEGRILAAKGDLKVAEVAFRRALALDPFNHPDYALDLASELLRAQAPDEALKVAGRMLANYPLAVVSNRGSDETVAPTLANLEALRGNVYLAKQQLNEARAAADRALKLDPQSLRGRALKHQVQTSIMP